MGYLVQCTCLQLAHDVVPNQFAFLESNSSESFLLYKMAFSVLSRAVL